LGQGGLVVVIRAVELDLFDQTEVGEVVVELFDEGSVDVGVEGVTGHVVLEVVEQGAGVGVEGEDLGKR
jgi:hypothetical protein